MQVRLWYNPRCSTCRKARAILEEAGAQVELVEYLTTPRTEAEWAALVDRVGGDPTKLLRAREPLFQDLKLEAKIAAGKLGRREVAALLAKHPRLLERPVVETTERSFVARPAEKAREAL